MTGCRREQMDKRSTVLVMDDAVVVRRLLVAMLSELDSVGLVVQASDAASALQLLREHRPEVAILDINVPGSGSIRNGIDVLRWAKRELPGTRFIMLTNHATEPYRSECVRAGADHFFDKSGEIEKLLDSVAAHGGPARQA